MKTATTYSYLIVANGNVVGHRYTHEMACSLARCYTEATISKIEGRLFSGSGQVKDAVAYAAAKAEAIRLWHSIKDAANLLGYWPGAKF